MGNTFFLKPSLFFACYLSLFSTLAQDYNLQFVKESSDGTTLAVKIQMAYTSTGAVGSSNLVFSYDGAEVNSPVLSMAHNLDAAVDADYGNMTRTVPETNNVSINIELLTDNAGTSLVADVWTDVATIEFSLPDAVGTANFQWLSSGTEETVAYLEDNDTFLSANTLSANDMTLESLALPVELINFEAVNDLPHIHLYWTTATELNNAYFEVHRSQDGTKWTLIGEVDGHGTTNQAQYYQFADASATGGTWYYRLKQVDYDGTFEYSEIVWVVNENADQLHVNIYPNPLLNELSIHMSNLLSSQQIDYRIITASGETMTRGVLNPVQNGSLSAKISIPSDWPVGIYMLQVFSGEYSFVRKLIKSD